MGKAKIKSWIQYWTNARMIAFGEIQSLADMTEARRWCSVMRLGVFSNVTDRQLWDALAEMRRA